jgi:hypothetical protein
MKIKIWKKPRDFRFGVVINPCGKILDFTTDRIIMAHFDTPVQWQNKLASMHFFGHGWGVEPNHIATQLLNHPHLVIRGTTYIVTKIEERFKMRAWATNAEVQNAIAHLGLSTSPVIDNVGKEVPQQDIYAATPEDLFAIRMCL